MDKASYLDFVVDMIRCWDDQNGFKVLPRRLVVERTFGRGKQVSAVAVANFRPALGG